MNTKHWKKHANFLEQLGPVTSRSPISELQTIIHMELFSRHRARSATVDTLQASSQFTSLYESVSAATWASCN